MAYQKKERIPKHAQPVDPLKNASYLVRTASHPLRLRILLFLAQQSKPQIVSNIIHHVQQQAVVVSGELLFLRRAGLVKNRKESRFVYYWFPLEHCWLLPILQLIYQKGNPILTHEETNLLPADAPGGPAGR